MPSPIGHALAGLAAAWAADLVPGNRAWRTAGHSASWYARAGDGLTGACAALAVAPDLDLFFERFHRSITHSVTAVVIVGVIAALLAARARRPATRVGGMCAGAWATHLLLDWLGVDRLYAPYGIQLFWPFGSAWFVSGWDLFLGTQRHNILGAAALRDNGAAIAREVMLLMPVVLGLWLIRVKALARLPSELPGGHHSPQ